MQFSLQQRTEILRLTLLGVPDNMIPKKVKPFRITFSQLQQARATGALPKRKAVLSFIIDQTLVKLGQKWVEDGRDSISIDLLLATLNRLHVKNPTGNAWAINNLRKFLATRDIVEEHKSIKTSNLCNLSTFNLEDITVFDDSLDPKEFIPVVDEDDLPKGVDPFLPKNERKESIKIAIQEALNMGIDTVGSITTFLNEKGLKSANGNDLSRWSVTLLMQEFQLECPKKVEASQFTSVMKDWIRTTPLEERINFEKFRAKIETLKEEGTLLQNVQALYGELSDLVADHNQENRDYLRGEEYRTQVEFAVYVKYKHRPITTEEIAKELGLSPMQANRVMREYLGIEPFKIWYENLYQVVKVFVNKNPDFKIEDLSDYLQSSYLETQRGCAWDFKNTRITYIKLQEKYPDLPFFGRQRAIAARR